MAQIRTLKLNLLADVTKFGAGMVEARGDVSKLSTAATRAGKAVAAAFTGMAIAAGYAAVRIGKDSVQAAIEDEKAQTQLAQTLRNVVNATDSAISSTEKWITKQQFATGISDNQLRPALATLTRATGDLSKAQSLTNLALDISVGTGKDLESVSLALAKAYNGNLGALTRLGVPLDENIKKTGDFDAAQKALAATFGGAAAANANTYAGRLAIVSERIGELKESIGADLLIKFDNLLKKVNEVAMGFGGEEPNSLSNKVKLLQNEMGYGQGTGAYQLGKSLKEVADAFGRLFDALTNDKNAEGISNLERLADAMTSVANAIDTVANAYTKAKTTIGKIQGFESTVSRFLTGSRAAGGSVSAGQAYRVGEFGPEMFVPNSSGRIVPNAGGGQTIINLNGIIDGESARRTIEKLLQDSARRTGAINLLGATL
jgi:hypothetical protein